MPPSKSLLKENFVQGVVEYKDHYLGDHKDHIRIVIPATFGDDDRGITIEAIVDTGGFCILDPKYAKELNITDSGLPASKIMVRNQQRSGRFYRIPIKLEPTDGKGIAVDALVFVPDFSLADEPMLPNFLGYEGFLEKIHFAVDPDKNLFYFGLREGEF